MIQRCTLCTIISTHILSLKIKIICNYRKTERFLFFKKNRPSIIGVSSYGFAFLIKVAILTRVYAEKGGYLSLSKTEVSTFHT